MPDAPTPAPRLTPAQQMIVDSFQSEVYIKNRMDVQNTPVYDTVSIAAAGTVDVLTTALFTNVGPASSKTLALTNMSQQQRLAAPEAFSVLGFRLRYQENILLADVLALYNGFCFEFFLGQKYYQRGPLWYYNAGGGVSGFSTLTSLSVYTNGLPSRESMHKLAIPVVIENQMQFYADLNGTSTTANASGTGIRIVALLDGLYARGVQ